MTWRLYRNLENSIKFFLDSQISVDALTGDNGVDVTVRVGRREDNNWALPCISVNYESETAPRFEMGSNKRDERYLLIVDIYATNEGERCDLAKWFVDTINDGFRYYTYAYNSSDPESPTKTAVGWANIDFLSNTRVNLGQNIDLIDAHRHRISLNVWIS